MKQSSQLLLGAIALAVAAFCGVAYADDAVKDSANYDKPGRQFDDNIVIDDNILTSGKRLDKPARAFDDGTVRSSKRLNKAAREIEDGSGKSGKHLSKSGRVVNEGTAKRKIRQKPIEE
jgi:hypothetical protein